MKRNIKLFCMDVDGTLTDGKIYICAKGEIVKAFNVKDGYGISTLLDENKIIPVIITGRISKIVEKRAHELGIFEVYQGVKNKVQILNELQKKYNCQCNDIAYMGDDIADLQAMKLCGFSGCPNDAVDSVKEISNFVSKRNGGEGAVREFIEWMIK